MTEVINGYTLTTKFTTAGGGQCQWAFAKRGDKEYFLKQFLKPKYPLPGAPGSPALNAKRLETCTQFADRHKLIMEKLKGLIAAGGNLVVASDFFRWEASYYKVTDRVKIGLDGVEAVARLSIVDKITLMLSVLRSLEILHRNNLVHGDIKPANILVGHGDTGPAAKLIDFDDCFVQGAAPPKDEVVGDMRYYSPEMVDVLLDDAPTSKLTTKVDIFALGLTFVEYLTGKLPTFSGERTAAEATRAGGELWVAVSGAEAERLAPVLQAMLNVDPASRPDCKWAQDALNLARREVKTGTITLPGAIRTSTPKKPGGKLLDKFRSAIAGSAPDLPVTAAPLSAPAPVTPTPPPPPAKPGGKLLDKLRAAEAAGTPTGASTTEPKTADSASSTPLAPRGKLLDKMRAADTADESKDPATAPQPRSKLLDKMRADRSSPPGSADPKDPVTKPSSELREEWPDALD